MLIGDMVTNNARRIPGREGLIWGNKRITWGELNGRVNRLANGLMDLGVQPGSRVAFLLNNSKEVVEVYYAIAKIGCASVPIMPRSVGREITYIANNVEVSAMVVGTPHSAIVEGVRGDMKTVQTVLGVGDGHPFGDDYEELIGRSSGEDPGVAVSPDDIYAIFHTSGTTGAPKGCILKHGPKMLSRLGALALTPHEEDDKCLIYTPLNLSFAADMLHNNVLRGIPTVLLPKFDETGILESIEREKITLALVIESTFDRLVEFPDLEKYDLSSIRYFNATSATRDASKGIRRLKKLKGFKARFWNAYGSTEGGGWVTFCSPQDIERGLEDPKYADVFKTVGREAMLCRIDCLDDEGNPLPPGEIGEMVISAPWLFAGYWKLPEQTSEVLRDGHLFTGDLARKDTDGFVYLEGRKRDMIKSGGINVYPAEIEQVLREHKKISEVAVVGVPDEHWGEKVVACVVVNEPCTQEAMIDYCADKLAGYKRPKSVVFYDSLPVDKAGKILKRQLRQEIISSSKRST